MVQWPSYFEPVLARYRTDRRLLAILAPLLGQRSQADHQPAALEAAGRAGRRVRLPPGHRLPAAAGGLSGAGHLLRPDRHRGRSPPPRERRDDHPAGQPSARRAQLREHRPGDGPLAERRRPRSPRARPRGQDRSLPRARRRRALASLHDPRLRPEPLRWASAGSTSTATSARRTATGANGRSARASPARSARRSWSTTRTSTPAPSRTTSTERALGVRTQPSKRLLRGKPCGAMRPAWPRRPSQGERSVTVRVPLAVGQLRPSARRSTAASASSPPL